MFKAARQSRPAASNKITTCLVVQRLGVDGDRSIWRITVNAKLFNTYADVDDLSVSSLRHDHAYKTVLVRQVITYHSAWTWVRIHRVLWQL